MLVRKEKNYGSQGTRRVLSGSATASVLPDYPTRPLAPLGYAIVPGRKFVGSFCRWITKFGECPHPRNDRSDCRASVLGLAFSPRNSKHPLWLWPRTMTLRGIPESLI